MRQSLERLGCRVTTYLTKPWTVHPPSFRRDLTREVDFLEEVARLTGYDKLPSTLPQVALRPPAEEPLARQVRERCVQAVTAEGFDEAITYRLVSRTLLSRAGATMDGVIRVSNPLTQEHEYLRTSLWPGLIEAAAVNLRRGAAGTRLCELGETYREENSRAVSRTMLGVLAAGQWDRAWTHGKRAADLAHVRGALEACLQALGVQDVVVAPAVGPWGTDAAWGALTLGGEMIGGCGELPTAIAVAFDLKERVWVGELRLEALLPHVRLERRYQPLPRFPAIRRDIALIAEARIHHQAIHDLIVRTGQPLVAHVELFDRYHGAQVPADHHGLAYAIEYRHAERTLTDDEVDALHVRVCEALVQQLRVTLRR